MNELQLFLSQPLMVVKELKYEHQRNHWCYCDLKAGDLYYFGCFASSKMKYPWNSQRDSSPKNQTCMSFSSVEHKDNILKNQTIAGSH